MHFSFKKFAIYFIAILFFVPGILHAQIYYPADTSIQNMVKEINRDRLKNDIYTLVNFGTRHTLSSITNPTRGIGAARNWVLNQFKKYAQQSGGRMTAHLDEWALQPNGRRIDRPVDIADVVAILKGTNPNDDRIFIVSGHLDSRRSNVMDSTGDAPGANDDASGVSAVMEMARIMSQRSFSATIIFVAVSGEEQGLFGSTHLAQEAKDSNWNIAAMLNNDIIGQCTSSETDNENNTKVRIFSEGIPSYETQEMTRMRKRTDGDNDSKSRELARYMKNIATEYVDNLKVVLMYRPDRFLRGGDHFPFQQRGYTAVRITEYYENFFRQHQDVRTENGRQYGDLPQFVNIPYLQKNTALNLATLASLANAPDVPQEVKISVSQLGNYTKLYWQPPKIGEAKGYYILMRETDEPMWQRQIFTKDTTIALPYSKDNYFFGVQAAGTNGLVSLPVFPGIGK